MYTRLSTYSTKHRRFDNTQQNNLYSSEESVSLFTDDTDTHCDYNISDHTPDTQDTNDTHMNFLPKHPAVHSQ